MKMLKKLMAVALAGALALTVLTGCGASIDRKEFVRVLNDSISFYIGNGYVELSDGGTAQADKVIALVQKAYDDTAEKDKAEFDPMDALYDSSATITPDSKLNPYYKSVEEALGINEKTNEMYLFNIVEVRKNTSEYNKKYATAQLAQDARNDCKTLNRADNIGNKGTVSFNTVALGDTEYLVVVVKIIA